MASTGSHRAKVATSWLLVVAVVIGLPAFLVWMVGNPFPSAIPDWGTVSRDINQRNVSGSVVVQAIALLVWAVWAQITWAIVWELVVAGPRVAKGIRTRSAPLVAGPLASLATRLVAAGLAAGVTASSNQTALPQRIIVAPDVVVSTANESIASNSSSEVELSDEQQWAVQPGESLWSISGEDQAMAAQILALNESISSPLDVVAGLSLRVPTSLTIPEDRVAASASNEVAGVEVHDALEEGAKFQTERAQRAVDAEPDTPRFSPSPDDGAAGEANETYWEPEELTVVPGDTIWGMAEQRLDATDQSGSEREVLDYVGDIVAENPEVQDNPDLIHPGQVLVLPSIGHQPEPSESQPKPEAPVETGQGESQAQQADDRAETNVVTLPSTRSSNEQAQPSTGLYDWVSRSRIDLGLGVGGALLGASALSLLRRRRLYRIAHRKRGTIPTDPDPRLDDIERILQAENPLGEAEWLSAAIASLSARPVWENEHVPVPVLARFDSNYLEVTLAEADEMGAPVPWETVDQGLRWRLARSTPLDAIPRSGVEYATPTFVTVAEGVMLNLEGVGVLRVEGGSEEVRMGILRSMVHELATSSSARWVDIRSTVAIPGTDGYPLVKHQPPRELSNELTGWLREFESFLSDNGRSNTYAYRLSAPEEPVAPVVLLIDRDDEPELRPVSLLAANRKLPVGVVQLGSGSISDHLGQTTVLQIDQSGSAVLQPFGLRFEPQTVSQSTANDLGLLLQNAASTDAAPLVANLQLSASVTSLSDRHKSSVVAKTGWSGSPDRVWSASDSVDPTSIDLDQSEIVEELEVSAERRAVAAASVPGSMTASRGQTAEVSVETSGNNASILDPGVVATAASSQSGPASSETSSSRPPVIDLTAEMSQASRRIEGHLSNETVEDQSLLSGQRESSAQSHPDLLDPDSKKLTTSPATAQRTALVLGEVAVDGFDAELTPQQLSLVTFLACVGEANRSTIVDALWDGKPISRSRFPNLLAETRAKIGRNTLPEARAGLYRLHGVSTDLGMFEKSVAEASKQQTVEAINTLKSALELVRGIPLATPNGRYWTWVGDHTHLAARVESLVADAALRLADLYRTVEDLDGAVWACERGLMACPIDENLVSTLAETYVASGKLGAARRLVDSWEDKINRLECGEPSDGPRNRLVG